MSTVVAARTASDVPLGPAQPRARSWWTGWRLALRMARRDVRRDRGRSWFVWLMIAVPVAILAAAQVLTASFDLSPIERARLITGGNQAAIAWAWEPFDPELNSFGVVGPSVDHPSAEARTPPGWGESLASKAAAVARLLNRPVATLTWSTPNYGAAEQGLLMLGLDPHDPALTGVIRLTDGRLPDAPNEVLVTSRGAAEGIPAAGPATITFGRIKTDVTVVGRADVQLLGSYDLIGYPQQIHDELSFLVPGDRPVTWDDAVMLARYGFETTSLDIVAHPPRPLPPSGVGIGPGDVALVIGLLQVALMVGPAFAIGAARQRRSLALAALNGADPRQLRRVALGQALLLGSTATLAGTLVGTGAGIAAWPAVASSSGEAQGPLDVPVPALALLLALGVLTAMGSALVTARGLARLSLVGALRGTVRSAPGGRRGTVAGILLLGLGLVAAWWPITRLGERAPEVVFFWFGGCVAALTGFLLTTPALLGILARLGRHAPVALRIALRDLARHRGRATAVVASVAGGVLLLTVVWTLVVSVEADEARQYIPETLAGQAGVTTGTGAESGLTGLDATIRSVDPRLRITRVAGPTIPKPGTKDNETLDLVGLRKGCTAAELQARGPVRPDCRSLIAYPTTGVLVADAADLVRLFRLNATQSDALTRGRLLVNTEPIEVAGGPTVNELQKGELQVAYLDDDTSAKIRTARIPALAITSDVIARGAPPTRYSVLASTKTAAALGWETSNWRLVVDHPDGPIAPATEQRLQEALTTVGVTVKVEHGFVPSPQPVLWLISGTLALLAVIGAAMATILAAAEMRPFLATFAAVGAPPSMTRRLATTQSVVLALLASGLGSLLGMVLGAPVGMVTTGWNGEQPIVVLPWLVAGLFVIGVPLVAGAVAALSTPREVSFTASTAD
ncbi:MAG: hypothetical protein QM582_08810 [Micropruina sp.]|uniref:FtsX-like permease family protein n=1 Tax=Micropruina sp. TaxID=2737536 RepID=UPI0039E471DB